MKQIISGLLSLMLLWGCGSGISFPTEAVSEVNLNNLNTEEAKPTEKNELKQYINLPHYDEGGWWFYWEYLPVHDKKGTYAPDFKANNEVFFKLFDDEYFEEYVDKCVSRISAIIEEARQ